MDSPEAHSPPQEEARTHPTQNAEDENTPTPSTQIPLSVVGIGASAGGLAALRIFITSLPDNTGLTFVVIVHLSPEHESVLAQLLQPYTKMPVMQVTQPIEMQPNHVYVIPPAKRLLVTEGKLELAEFDMPRGKRLQIDVFFRSLAEHHGDGAAVILSGAGSDGAVGIQSIKEGGGLILVQDPLEAEYSGMPQSAIATGLVDLVAPVAELATKLVAAKRSGALLELPLDPEQLSTAAEESVTKILTHLHVRTGHDFGGYKRSTILRRIARRMGLVQVSTLSSYLHRLRQDGEEAAALYRDLLIHVTEFFRDPEAWEALAEQVIPGIFAGKGPDDQIRVWTVGCATGEEAYGIAMLLIEHATGLTHPPRIQVFASDLGDLALDFARKGIYPEAIAASVTPPRLERFFVEDNSHYRVRDELRQVVLFTPHNLLQDPPFSKLSLILCRNLLIYLQRDLQERVFESFHYALHHEPDGQGFLFLGSAESPEGISDLFVPVDKHHRIYRRNEGRQGALVLPSLPLRSTLERQPTKIESRSNDRPRSGSSEHAQLLETVAPPSLLVDRHYRVHHISKTAGRYLLHPGGYLTDDVFQLVRLELQSELRSALFRAIEVGKATVTRPVPVRFNGSPHPVSLMVKPTDTEQAQALVFFLEDETPLPVDVDAVEDAVQSASLRQMQTELGQAQQHLQSLREEYETTVEELRAANEELQSTNEEYRSTLEELETSKEELQSINEELQTVNLELKNKVDETAQAHNDLQNLLTATQIATIFLDRDLRIKRYTPAAVDLFNLMPPDLERPIGHLRSNLHYPELENDVRKVLRTLTAVAREVKRKMPNGDMQWFMTNIRPYRTYNDRINGVVITFVDITVNKRAEEELRRSEEQFRALVDASAQMVWTTDAQGRVVQDSLSWRTFTGQTHEERQEWGWLNAIHPDDRARAEAGWQRSMETARPYTNEFRVYHVATGDYCWTTVRAVPLMNSEGSVRGWVGMNIDINERKQAEENLREFNRTLEQQVIERTTQVRDLIKELTLSEQAERRRISALLHDDLQQRVFGIQFQIKTLQNALETEESAKAVAQLDAMNDALLQIVQIIRTLSVDLSPPVLYDEGLTESIRWLASQMYEQHGLVVHVQAPDVVLMSHEDLRVLLFQIVRELLFNVVKHAKVQEVYVTLSHVNDHVRIEVRDNGVGVDAESVMQNTSGAHGLMHSRRRIELMGGALDVASSPKGTRVVVLCPIDVGE
ncbi:PAS domain S-box protein [bacterium]|nr:PAS domain S-box protein [bacterium]